MLPAPATKLPAMPAVLASTCPEPAAGVSWSLTQVLYMKTENPARFVFAQIWQGWICAAWAVLGPWCEIYLALGLEQGLLVEFPKGSAAIEVSFFQSQA